MKLTNINFLASDSQYRVLVDGEEVSRHNTMYKAIPEILRDAREPILDEAEIIQRYESAFAVHTVIGVDISQRDDKDIVRLQVDNGTSIISRSFLI